MLHDNRDIISPKTLQLLRRIQKDHLLRDFFLVGGTALALQIGHRFSVDLDFFTTQPFDTQDLSEYLANSNSLIPLKALIYFEDIDAEADPPIMVRKMDIDNMKDRLYRAVKNPELVFAP